MIIYFDTETTGLRPGNICQLSYVMQDTSEAIGKNFFFQVDYMPKEVEAIHGLSVEKLKVLSGGKTIKDYITEIERDFTSADLIVAHNVQFDLMFMMAEFENCGRHFKYNESFCSMKRFTPICKILRSKGEGYKYPRLNELCAFLGIGEEDVNRAANSLFDGSTGFHDARFDTVAVYLAINKVISRGADIWGLEKYL